MCPVTKRPRNVARFEWPMYLALGKGAVAQNERAIGTGARNFGSRLDRIDAANRRGRKPLARGAMSRRQRLWTAHDLRSGLGLPYAAARRITSDRRFENAAGSGRASPPTMRA